MIFLYISSEHLVMAFSVTKVTLYRVLSCFALTLVSLTANSLPESEKRKKKLKKKGKKKNPKEKTF